MTEARVRMPRLLREAESGGRRELREAGRLRPLALEAEMNLYPLSRAEMVLHERDLPLKIHDLVELYGLNGSLGVFRVTAIEREYGRKRRVRLSHGLDTLADAVLANGAAGGTLAEALGQALAAQNSVRWRLGTVEDAGTYDGTEAGDTALAYVTALARQAAGGRLTCDMGEYPWVLGYASDSGRVESEFRLGRNLDDCQMTLDDSLLCTRLRVTAETWEDEEPRTVEEVYDDPAGQAAWGVIEKCVRLDGVDDRAGWARQYFARYGQPETQIRISGRELFRLTGERLDETRLGTLCRVALPDHGAVLEERIVSVRYADLLRRPEEVTVCLAAKAQEMGGALAGLRRSEARTARRVDTAEREIIRQRVETGLRLSAHDRHITQYGEILHAAGLEIDPHGVWLYAGEDGPNYALGASFKVQADAISSEVSRATNAESGLSGSISTVKQTADSVSLEVRNARAGEATLGARFAVVVNQIVSEVTDRTNADSALSSRITQTAESITSEVERATNAESGLSGSISTVKQTADSVSLEVANARGDSPTLVSRLQVLSNAITSEVTDRTNADSTLSSRITQTAESITSEVERATNAESGLSGSISTVKQTADSVSAEVRNARGDSATLVAAQRPGRKRHPGGPIAGAERRHHQRGEPGGKRRKRAERQHIHREADGGQRERRGGQRPGRQRHPGGPIAGAEQRHHQRGERPHQCGKRPEQPDHPKRGRHHQQGERGRDRQHHQPDGPGGADPGQQDQPERIRDGQPAQFHPVRGAVRVRHQPGCERDAVVQGPVRRLDEPEGGDRSEHDHGHLPGHERRHENHPLPDQHAQHHHHLLFGRERGGVSGRGNE